MARASVTPARQTIFALVSAFERDVRDLLGMHLHTEGAPQEVLGAEVAQRAEGRLVKESRASSTAQDWVSLLEFTDLGDALALLNRHRTSLPEALQEQLSVINYHTGRLIGARNRLSHTRPLDEGDFPEVLEFSQKLAQDERLWPELHNTVRRLREDPSFLLGIEIPAEDPARLHNLPTPEWDETGFLGRRELITKVKRVLGGAYPVVSIVGEGGLGKTALALRVAYDALDDDDSPYDAIVWTTAKTTKLTANEIQRVENAITTSLGLLQDVATELAGGNGSKDALDTILEYLSEFRILLVLDNLETVLDEMLEDFFASIPPGSKIITTSRIGLGKFEVPLKLEPMAPAEGARLIRALARTRGMDDLYRAPDERLHDYVRRLHHNPGAMRWFVSVVATGVRPEDALKDQSVFLEFCMSNIYGYLSERARGVLRALLCVPGMLTQPELAHFTDLSVDDLQAAIIELMRTNTVRRSTLQLEGVNESAYEINDLARQYLAKHEPATSLEYEWAQRKRGELESHGRSLSIENATPFEWKSVRVKTRSEIAVARKLQGVIAAVEGGELDQACQLAESARDLAPEFFETHRLLAEARAAKGDVGGAKEAFEAAIDCGGDHASVHYHYGRFLSRNLGYLDEAQGALKVAAKKSDRARPVLAELTRVVVRSGDLEAAYDLLSELDGLPRGSSRDERDLLYLKVMYYLANVEMLLSRGEIDSGVDFMEALVALIADHPPSLLTAETRAELRRLNDMKDDIVGWMPPEAFTRWQGALVDVRHLCSPTREDEEADVLEAAATGVIKSLKQDRFGFIRADDGQEYFFHERHLYDDASWDSLRTGMSVQFRAVRGARGLRALDVKVAA